VRPRTPEQPLIAKATDAETERIRGHRRPQRASTHEQRRQRQRHRELDQAPGIGRETREGHACRADQYGSCDEQRDASLDASASHQHECRAQHQRARESHQRNGEIVPQRTLLPANELPGEERHGT